MAFIDVRIESEKVQKHLNDIAMREFPIAIAWALTALAVDVQEAEKASLFTTFDRPTPFTVNAIRIIPAKKDTGWSEVFVMDTAAAYLYPYEVGGFAKLIGKGVTWLKPADYSLLNQYGNFSQNRVAQLKAKGSVFIVSGDAKFGKNQHKLAHGIWERIGAAPKSGKRPRGKVKGRGLRLLIKFGDPKQTRQHLDFQKRAEMIVRKNFNKRFGSALGKAIAMGR